jgi:hypothetical protein
MVQRSIGVRKRKQDVIAFVNTVVVYMKKKLMFEKKEGWAIRGTI